jgi:HEAT repeats
MMGALGDDSMNSDSPDLDGTHAGLSGWAFTARTGQDYRAIVGDVKKIEGCLHHTDPAYRALALQLCGVQWHPNSECAKQIMEMARRDPNEFIRSMAIIALSSMDLVAESKRSLRFFATLALDEAEPELVRKAAYQSAVLCEPDFEKTKHILAHRTYMITDVTIGDFDLKYLRRAIAH